MKNNRYVIPCFIPMEGCRNRCVYCDQRSVRESRGSRENIREIIDRYIGYTGDRSREVELAFYGGTFMNLSVRRLNSLLAEAMALKASGVIQYVRISTTPDSVNPQTLRLIEGKVDTVELGVQTLSPLVLAMTGRNGGEADVVSATTLLKRSGINVGHQLMIGLPLETDGSFAETVRKSAAMKPDFVRLYPLVVFRNTPLDVYVRTETFTPAEEDVIFRRGAYALWKFGQESIPVIRVGLTSCIEADRVSSGSGVGDYRGKMESLLWRVFLTDRLRADFPKGSRILVECSEKDYNGIIGHGKENLVWYGKSGWQVSVRRGSAAEGSVCLSGDYGREGRYNLSDMAAD